MNLLLRLLLLAFATAWGQDPYQPYLGFYSIVGEKPKAFVEFDNFVLTDFGPNGLKGRVVPPEGRVRDFLRAKLQNATLSFDTRRVDGISYSFSGIFLKAPPVPSDGKTPVLEGTLKRFRNGVASGSAKLRFSISEGGGE